MLSLCIYFVKLGNGVSNPNSQHGKVRSHVSVGVFTLKPVPNWINWNRFTELGFDDLLAFILVIWNRFSLHVIAQVLPVVAATVVQRLRRYGPVLGGVCSTVG